MTQGVTEHVRLVEEGYWFLRYEVDPVPGVDIHLTRTDYPAAWGSMFAGQYSEIKLRLETTVSKTYSTITCARRRSFEIIRRLFSNVRHGLFPDERGRAQIISSMSREHLRRLFSKEQLQAMRDLLLHPRRTPQTAALSVTLHVNENRLVLSLAARHETGSNIRKITADIEKERNDIIAALAPYDLALMVQRLAALKVSPE